MCLSIRAIEVCRIRWVWTSPGEKRKKEKDEILGDDASETRPLDTHLERFWARADGGDILWWAESEWNQLSFWSWFKDMSFWSGGWFENHGLDVYEGDLCFWEETVELTKKWDEVSVESSIKFSG